MFNPRNAQRKGQSLANYKMGDIWPNRSQSALCVGHGVLGLRSCPPHSRGPRSLTSCMLGYMEARPETGMFISEPVIFPRGWNHQRWCGILRSQDYKDAFRNTHRNCRDNAGGGAAVVGWGTRGPRSSASTEFFILQKPRKRRPPTSCPGPVLQASESVPAGVGCRSSVAQGLAALQHAAEDDLHACRGT